jgi:hypothetical protein
MSKRSAAGAKRAHPHRVENHRVNRDSRCLKTAVRCDDGRNKPLQLSGVRPLDRLLKPPRSAAELLYGAGSGSGGHKALTTRKGRPGQILFICHRRRDPGVRCSRFVRCPFRLRHINTRNTAEPPGARMLLDQRVDKRPRCRAPSCPPGGAQNQPHYPRHARCFPLSWSGHTLHVLMYLAASTT